jgi:hypothetical protein
LGRYAECGEAGYAAKYRQLVFNLRKNCAVRAEVRAANALRVHRRFALAWCHFAELSDGHTAYADAPACARFLKPGK